MDLPLGFKSEGGEEGVQAPKVPLWTLESP